jgi:hypothetical protein
MGDGARWPLAGVRHDEFLHVRRRVAHDDRHVESGGRSFSPLTKNVALLALID